MDTIHEKSEEPVIMSSMEQVYDVFDIRNIPSLLSSFDESIAEGYHDIEKNSVGAFMFLSQNESKASFGFKQPEADKADSERLSLAYERLHRIPKVLLTELAPKIKILDISHNEFDNLDFLKSFKQVTTLICDRNNLTSTTRLPFMPRLELLWLNHCKIVNLYPWIKHLQESAPNLKFLSLMGNKAAPSLLNGGNFYEYLQYRLFVISLFPRLVHLDDTKVTDDQRVEAKKLNKKPLLERLCFMNKIPAYLRTVSELFTTMSGTSNEPAVHYDNYQMKSMII